MSVLVTIGLLGKKYGETAAGQMVGTIERWATRRRFARIEALLQYINYKASAFNLPGSFEEQEEFEDFTFAVLDAATRTANEVKIKLLAYVLLNEALDGSRVSYEVKAKIQELLPLVQVHHVELLRIISQHSVTTVAAGTRASAIVCITELERLYTLRGASSADRLDLFYGAVSDLLRWYLIRSTVDAGVNVAKAAAFIPGTGTMGFVRTTQVGEKFLGYLRDPNGAFIDLSALEQETIG